MQINGFWWFFGKRILFRNTSAQSNCPPTPQIELSVKNPLAIFFASLIRSLAQAAAGLVFGADVLSLKMGWNIFWRNNFYLT